MASTFKNAGMTIVHTDDSNADLYTAGGSVYAVIHAVYISNNSTTNTGVVDIEYFQDSYKELFERPQSIYDKCSCGTFVWRLLDYS